jgi:uncharacterized protein YciI
MKFFLCKFIPPRRDFLQTLNPDERALMTQHVAFMDDLLDERVIVAHGPVEDPVGAWGLSLYQVQDDEDIVAITANDPMVERGGARYEIFPMQRLKTRG